MKVIIEVPSTQAFQAMKDEFVRLLEREYSRYVDMDGNPLHTIPPALAALLHSLDTAYYEVGAEELYGER